MKIQRGVVPLVLAGLIAVGACADDGDDGLAGTTDGSVPAAETSGPAPGSTAGDPGGTAPPASRDTTPSTSGPDSTATGGTAATAPAVSDPPQGSTDTVYTQGDIDPGLQPFITIAVDDLAARLGVDSSAITTLSAVLVVWPNAALGCPQPGMQYAQVPVDGSVIELGAGGRVYRYHTGGSTPPFLCDQPLTDKPPSGDVLD